MNSILLTSNPANKEQKLLPKTIFWSEKFHKDCLDVTQSFAGIASLRKKP